MTVNPVPGPGFGRPDMLAANADRERAIDVLRAGFAEGRLTKAEFDNRAARIYAARTYGELGALVADLPAGSFGQPVPYQNAGYPVRQPAYAPTSSLAVAALVCGIGEFFTMGLTAIPAVILGHLARREVRETGRRGDGMALTGLILGWAGIGLIAVMITALVVVGSHSGPAAHPIFHRVPGPPPGPLP